MRHEVCYRGGGWKGGGGGWKGGGGGCMEGGGLGRGMGEYRGLQPPYHKV